MLVYESIGTFKNCDWYWSLKLHSWIWIELGFVRSLIYVLLSQNKKRFISVFLHLLYMIFVCFSFFQKIVKSPYKSYCIILWLVHSLFSWKIWMYKSCNYLSLLFIRDLTSFSIQKRRFCLFQLGRDHINLFYYCMGFILCFK